MYSFRKKQASKDSIRNFPSYSLQLIFQSEEIDRMLISTPFSHFSSSVWLMSLDTIPVSVNMQISFCSACLGTTKSLKCRCGISKLSSRLRSYFHLALIFLYSSIGRLFSCLANYLFTLIYTKWDIFYLVKVFGCGNTSQIICFEKNSHQMSKQQDSWLFLPRMKSSLHNIPKHTQEMDNEGSPYTHCLLV